MKLSQDFSEFIELLQNHEVKYLVVGGYAMAYHGYPRFTQDIDFWIWINEENAERLLLVIKDFGMGSLGLKVEDFDVADQVVQLGYPPNRIDIITSVDGLSFEQAYANKVEFLSSSVKINFIGFEDLIKNKTASGRLRDLADVEMLEKIKNNKSKP